MDPCPIYHLPSTIYLSVIPAIRTIPGVERFDYAIPQENSLHIGDLIRVPFRKRLVPALVAGKPTSSAFADRIVTLEPTPPLLHLSPLFVEFIERASHRTFTSQPTVLDACIRHVPKRILPVTPASSLPHQIRRGEQSLVFTQDRWHDRDSLIARAKKSKGRTLILTPWQHRAEYLAAQLSVPVLHGDVPPTQAWNMLSGFVNHTINCVVTTRLGAWLSLYADTILIDEPENDDFKQDELSPRLDARWVVSQCADLRPEISVVAFSTTPELSLSTVSWTSVPTIQLSLSTEIFQRHSSSQIENLSSSALQRLEEACTEKRPITILHPIQGERARIKCRDCGWEAPCPECGFALSLIRQQATASSMGLCHRCGKRSIPPENCAACGGTDLSKSRAGRDRLARILEQHFPECTLHIFDLPTFQRHTVPKKSLVILTDLSLLAGAAEDIRRKERLIIAWRRFAATLANAEAELLVQGPEETVTECRAWLTAEGVYQAWEKERRERQIFGFPPATRLIKIIALEEAQIEKLMKELRAELPSEIHIRGPYPIPFRPKSRKSRTIFHLVTPLGMPETALRPILERLKKHAIIDLDPIGFFS